MVMSSILKHNANPAIFTAIAIAVAAAAATAAAAIIYWLIG